MSPTFSADYADALASQHEDVLALMQATQMSDLGYRDQATIAWLKDATRQLKAEVRT